MYKIQSVYVPVKVEDERTSEFYKDRLFLLKGSVRDVGDYFGDGIFYSQVETKTTQEVTHWLKEEKGYFFTTEQLNELLSNVIKDTLEAAAKNAKTEFQSTWRQEIRGIQPDVDKQSILNTFEETYKKYKV